MIGNVQSGILDVGFLSYYAPLRPDRGWRTAGSGREVSSLEKESLLQTILL